MRGWWRQLHDCDRLSPADLRRIDRHGSLQSTYAARALQHETGAKYHEQKTWEWWQRAHDAYRSNDTARAELYLKEAAYQWDNACYEARQAGRSVASARHHWAAVTRIGQQSRRVA